MSRKMFMILRIISVITLFGSIISIVFSQTNPNNSSNHIIIEIDGSAEYRNRDWANNSWQPLSVGLPVYSNWFIRPTGQSTVDILCADGSTVRIRSEMSSPQCHDIPPSGILNLNSLITSRSQRGSAPSNVVILTPVDRIASVTPTITWLPSGDFTSYRITIVQSGLPVFTVDVQDTSYVMTDSTILMRGNSYNISVTPLSAINDQQFTYRDTVEVSILSSDDFGRITQRSQNYQLSVAPTGSEEIAIYTEAWAYYQSALFSETAISLSRIIDINLDAFIGNPAQLSLSPYPYIMIGDSFQGTGYTQGAEIYYFAALDLATSIGDGGSVTIILDRLGDLSSDVSVSDCYFEQVYQIEENLFHRSNEEFNLNNLGSC